MTSDRPQSVTGTVQSAAAEPRHESLDRIRRMFALFAAVGYVGYLLLLLPAITQLAPAMSSWWTPAMCVIVFLPGFTIGLAALVGVQRWIRSAATVAAISFFVAVATWPAAWDGTILPAGDGVWLAAFPGLASIAAVLAWPAWAAFAHMVLGCVCVQLINFVARGSVEPGQLAPEIAFAIMFCSLFVGASVMALRTGRVLDETTDRAHAAAATAAAERARDVERERFDALIHDSVMSTLLTASRGGAPEHVPRLAAATLAELDEIRSGLPADRPLRPAAAVVHLRATATEAHAGAEFTVVASATEAAELPSEAVRAVSAALAEALRNSRRHAGDEVRCTVRGRVDADSIRIEAVDDGVGFDPAAVSTHRLGIAVSIRARMDRIPGGSASVQSAPGAGTTVRLEWAR
ncbi:MAG: ATP-binding protein [Gordonia sp. (in: high G+C Gram-positive bacteria)]|uniref:sensor histidine kinase n=1 Tax=Gordonia TaxID=2053 RepID=UPI00326633B6